MILFEDEIYRTANGRVAVVLQLAAIEHGPIWRLMGTLTTHVHGGPFFERSVEGEHSFLTDRFVSFNEAKQYADMNYEILKISAEALAQDFALNCIDYLLAKDNHVSLSRN